MTGRSDAPPPARSRWWVIALCAMAITAFIGANGHLIYVSVSSQPDCVPHLKAPVEGAALYRAAKSSC